MRLFPAASRHLVRPFIRLFFHLKLHGQEMFWLGALSMPVRPPTSLPGVFGATSHAQLPLIDRQQTTSDIPYVYCIIYSLPGLFGWRVIYSAAVSFYFFIFRKTNYPRMYQTVSNLQQIVRNGGNMIADEDQIFVFGSLKERCLDNQFYGWISEIVIPHFYSAYCRFTANWKIATLI